LNNPGIHVKIDDQLVWLMRELEVTQRQGLARFGQLQATMEEVQDAENSQADGRKRANERLAA